MKKIVLTAAALLALSGSAFAVGSDHFNPNVTPAGTAIDNTHTASVPNAGSPVYKLLNAGSTEKPATPGSDRNLFGNN
jgi:hypothetical protein